MGQWWQRAVGPFKAFGYAVGALYLLNRALQAISPRLRLIVYELMEQPIDGRPLLKPNLVKNLEFVEIGPGHPAISQMPACDDIKQLRFRQGARCLGVYRNGVLLGYLWCCRGRYEEDEVRCTFLLEPAEASVFDFDVYVLPEHRMGIAFLAIWHAANEWLYAQGVRHSFSRITLFNLPSRRAHARLGGRRIGSAFFLHVWGAECMFSTLPPYVGLSTRGDTRMNLRMTPAQSLSNQPHCRP